MRNPQRFVMTTMGLSFLLGWANWGLVKKQAPPLRFYVGNGGTFIALSMLADFAPGATGPVSLLILTTVLLTEGGPALQAIDAQSKSNQASPASTPGKNTPAKPGPSRPGPSKPRPVKNVSQAGFVTVNAAQHLFGG